MKIITQTQFSGNEYSEMITLHNNQLITDNSQKIGPKTSIQEYMPMEPDLGSRKMIRT